MKSKYKRGTNPNSHKPTKTSNISRSKKLEGRKWTEDQNKRRSKTLLNHDVSNITKNKIKKNGFQINIFSILSFLNY